MGAINHNLQGHMVISTQEMAFNVTLVRWSRPAKGCYTSQTCSCLLCGTNFLKEISKCCSTDVIWASWHLKLLTTWMFVQRHSDHSKENLKTLMLYYWPFVSGGFLSQKAPDSKVHGANMGPPGSCRPQMGPMLAPLTFLSGTSNTGVIPCHVMIIYTLLLQLEMMYVLTNNVDYSIESVKTNSV